MENTRGPARLAVLIDGDNFGSDLADDLFWKISMLGTASIRRVYGTSNSMVNWRDASAKHSIGLQEVLPGSNAADMKLTIDAMDILHRGKVDGFCIVSSDSDFAELARRLREDGMVVHGFSSSKPSAELERACDDFVPLAAVVKKVAAPIKPKTTAPATKPKPQGQKSPARVLLDHALERLEASNTPATLAAVGQELGRLEQGFSCKRFKATSIKALAVKAGLVINRDKQPWVIVAPASDRVPS